MRRIQVQRIYNQAGDEHLHEIRIQENEGPSYTQQLILDCEELKRLYLLLAAELDLPE